MKATRTIELGKGATLEITSELNVLKTEGDSWEGIPAEYDIWIKTDFAFCMGGKRCENLMYHKKDATFKFWNWIPAEAEAILTKADVGLRIALKAENAEKVEKAIEETRNEVMTDEAREFFAKKEQAKKNGQKKEGGSNRQGSRGNHQQRRKAPHEQRARGMGEELQQRGERGRRRIRSALPECRRIRRSEGNLEEMTIERLKEEEQK